jgi:hypothetical protein
VLGPVRTHTDTYTHECTHTHTALSVYSVPGRAGDAASRLRPNLPAAPLSSGRSCGILTKLKRSFPARVTTTRYRHVLKSSLHCDFNLVNLLVLQYVTLATHNF